MAEDIDLAAELDALDTSKGPQRLTCEWWATATDKHREAVIRNVKAKTYTAVAKRMRELGVKVTGPGIRDHAAGKCDKCQISQTS